MRCLTLLGICALTGIFCGCASSGAPSSARQPAAINAPPGATDLPGKAPVVLPVAGKVASVNAALGFVVLDFSLGGMPGEDQRLNVYRSGQKVAQLRVSGPHLGGLIVADIVAGTVQAGDQARMEQ